MGSLQDLTPYYPMRQRDIILPILALRAQDMPLNINRRKFSQLAFLHLLSLKAGAVFSTDTQSSWLPEPEEAGYVPTPQGRLWYRINGKEHIAKGKTPLVCLHGGPGASHHYLLPLVDLADERPVIFYDQLDCGLSDRPNDKTNWTVDRFVSEIDVLRNALNLSQVALYGNSCGSTWIAPYAAAKPAGLRAVIFASPYLAAEPFLQDVKKLRAELPPEILQTMEKHEAAGTTDSDEYHEAVFAWYQRHVCRNDPWPDYLMRTIELFSNDLYHYMWGPAEPKLDGVLKDFDAREALREIDSPSWYVCGEFDEMTPQTTKAFAELTPGAQFTAIKGASHTPHIEQRETFMRAAREFLAANAD